MNKPDALKWLALACVMAMAAVPAAAQTRGYSQPAYRPPPPPPPPPPRPMPQIQQQAPRATIGGGYGQSNSYGSSQTKIYGANSPSLRGNAANANLPSNVFRNNAANNNSSLRGAGGGSTTGALKGGDLSKKFGGAANPGSAKTLKGGAGNQGSGGSGASGGLKSKFAAAAAGTTSAVKSTGRGPYGPPTKGKEGQGPWGPGCPQSGPNAQNVQQGTKGCLSVKFNNPTRGKPEPKLENKPKNAAALGLPQP